MDVRLTDEEACIIIRALRMHSERMQSHALTKKAEQAAKIADKLQSNLRV
jgi:hypothetical protein